VGVLTGLETLPIHIFEIRNTISFHTLQLLFTYLYVSSNPDQGRCTRYKII
jgi:hypothetical protein